MAENLNLEMGEMLNSQKISILDQKNSGSFVVDMESFKDATITPNSRISRSLSRKWSPRGERKKKSSDSIVGFVSSPRGACSGAGTGSPSTAEPSAQVHQITIGAGNTDGGALVKGGSFRRSSTWGLEPRRIVILSASLSSIGTMLLIYLTLSICYKAEGSNLELEWQL